MNSLQNMDELQNIAANTAKQQVSVIQTMQAMQKRLENLEDTTHMIQSNLIHQIWKPTDEERLQSKIFQDRDAIIQSIFKRWMYRPSMPVDVVFPPEDHHFGQSFDLEGLFGE